MMRDLDRELIDAAWRNDLATARRLIAEGADVNAKDDTVQSAFLFATSEGFHELLMLTLAHGADINAKDSYNGTGLIRAADRGHARIIGTLLQAGTEVDHINRLGWTALHEAIILGDGREQYVDCVRLLLAYGADPTLVSQGDGISPLQHATRQGFDVIAQTLQIAIEGEAVANPSTALEAAIAAGDGDAAMLAIQAGAVPIPTHLTPVGGTANAAERLAQLLSPQD